MLFKLMLRMKLAESKSPRRFSIQSFCCSFLSSFWFILEVFVCRHAPDVDGAIWLNYLPLIREFLPEAAVEIEHEIETTEGSIFSIVLDFQ